MSRVQTVEVREVLYILDPPKPPTNGWGTAGFIFSIFGIFTGGLLSPIALLMCLLGLRKRPRSFAMIGLLLSLLGTAFLGSIVAVPVIAAHRHHRAMEQRYNIDVTRQILSEVDSKVAAQARYMNERLDGYSGNAVTIQHQDAWETDIRFDERNDGYAVRSAGPDRRFDSRDDLIIVSQWSNDLREATPRSVGLELDLDQSSPKPSAADSLRDSDLEH